MTLEEFKGSCDYKNIISRSMKFVGSFKHTLEYEVEEYSIFYTGNNYRNEFKAQHKVEDFEWGIDYIEIGREPTYIVVHLI